MRTLLTNATLIDCVQPRAVEGAAVLIEDGRIHEIRTDGSAPAAHGATAIDLRGAWLMPDYGTSTSIRTTTCRRKCRSPTGSRCSAID